MAQNYGSAGSEIQAEINRTIYCAGDVVGPYQFTHVAAHQAWFAAVNALFGKLKSFKVDYRVIPWTTYTDPEVARVGINETDAAEKNILTSFIPLVILFINMEV
jgi:pyruvate/2-oxoglutarate dehydrogenase complex dihydrolipoamide dehydrogenase (E3) component